MRRFSLLFGWSALILAAVHNACAAQNIRGDTRDPFAAAPVDADPVAPVVAARRSPDPGGGVTPAGYAEPARADAPRNAGSRHPYLFPDGPPESSGPDSTDWIYPGETVPTQYPLDDGAYRGAPQLYPPAARPPDYFTDSNSTFVPSPGPVPIVSFKTTKDSLTFLFGSGNSLGITSLDFRSTLQFGRWPGFFITPQFGVHFLSGPSRTDLPPRLYDFSLDFSVYRPVGNWLFHAALTPSLFTDGDNTTSDAVRILGRGMAYYTASPTLQYVGGIIYLDRQDLPVLPSFGVVLTPREDLRYELVFPKPRLAWRQVANPIFERWVYVTGELGGQSWAIERTTKTNDIATYRDLRLVVGMENKQTDGRSWYVEGGYVFGRELEYESGVGDFSLSATGFLRFGSAY